MEGLGIRHAWFRRVYQTRSQMTRQRTKLATAKIYRFNSLRLPQGKHTLRMKDTISLYLVSPSHFASSLPAAHGSPVTRKYERIYLAEIPRMRQQRKQES